MKLLATIGLPQVDNAFAPARLHSSDAGIRGPRAVLEGNYKGQDRGLTNAGLRSELSYLKREATPDTSFS